ncbi:uncharacterized protein LAESUDRAFT_755736 [Laetiporus sulphureus 93-53]|uniref:Uncharacterized protein n=1 Tax=Laetiporus sulphureus 93-53 TaxID=1314785 RepID=A0A165GEB1_9APHY|nr:uncharacterized protein LAESUDRAFT_755736 [Laetiporus sulphureus 93-53]KZT10229.1 hypothetical protein LAESUDRAFT_755736 [Laetiporus sulphureus 93-53]
MRMNYPMYLMEELHLPRLEPDRRRTILTAVYAGLPVGILPPSYALDHLLHFDILPAALSFALDAFSVVHGTVSRTMTIPAEERTGMANIHITDWYEEEERLLEGISSGPPFPLLDHRLLLLEWELYEEIYPWDKENRPAIPPPPMSLNIRVTTTVTRSASEPGLLLDSDGDELPLLGNLSDEALAESWRSARWGDDEDETGRWTMGGSWTTGRAWGGDDEQARSADDEQPGYPHHPGATYPYNTTPEDGSQPAPADTIKEQIRYARTVKSSSNPVAGQVSLIAPDVASPYDVFIATPLTFLMERDGHHLYKVTWHLYSEDSPYRVFSQWVALLYPPPIPGMHDWHPTPNRMSIISVHFAGKEEGVEQYEVELFRTFSDQVHYRDAKTPREFTPVIFQPLVAMIERPGWLTDSVEALKAVLYEDGSISHWAPTEFHPQPQEDLDAEWEVVPHTTIPVYGHVGVRGGR